MRYLSTAISSLFIFCFLFIACQINAQTIDAYFEKIRKNESELTAFISQMPKGGDLHNHYSGAVYGESYIKWLLDSGLCINIETLELAKADNTGSCNAPFSKLSYLNQSMSSADYEALKYRLLRYWSTLEYDQLHTDSRAEHFFTTFSKFNAASGLDFEGGLKELKQRAIAEKLSYLEVMLPNITCKKPNKNVFGANDDIAVKNYNDRLVALGINQNQVLLKNLLDSLYKRIQDSLPVKATADGTNAWVDGLHKSVDGSGLAMRYLAFVSRNTDPLQMFMNTITAFETVSRSKGNIVGLNIVSREDGTISMRDYWLHMQMFKFCHAQYPNVKYSMHAGELTGGMVPPEELKWHINWAVSDAGANRIGHGVDIAYEKDNYQLLNYMSSKPVPVEINLLSNEFILGVKNDKHPVLLYKRFNVPIVISTDDPDISRTSLTEQYVLLAKRYDEVSYQDIKKYVYNSIQYSFMEEALKQKITVDLKERFSVFEEYILSNKR